MSTIIRLSMVGKAHQHTYRVVAQDKRAKRDGRFLEILGNVNPFLDQEKQVSIKKDRVSAWQKNGAQLSPTVAYLIKNGKLPPRPKKVREKVQPSQAQEPQEPQSPKQAEQKADVQAEEKQEPQKAEDPKAETAEPTKQVEPATEQTQQEQPAQDSPEPTAKEE